MVCADNALPHPLTARDVGAALAETRQVLRPGEQKCPARPPRPRRADGDLPAVARGRRRGAVRPGALPAAAGRRHLDDPDGERDVRGAAGGGDGRVRPAGQGDSSGGPLLDAVVTAPPGGPH
ncbi:hypothetical protein [Streptomyces spororaveus]|uniref:hypothetical protein n=1 Tax=Streptomyces spororaveus TaxID=284039 RepID=UPI001F38E671|nr:hypothetical protein [Streptomyces spororaveus]